MMYRMHCQNIVDVVISGSFEEVGHLIFFFLFVSYVAVTKYGKEFLMKHYFYIL